MSATSNRRGATLLELLVIAGVVAVLIGVMIPILRSIAIRKDDVQDVANAGAILKEFRLWSGDRDDIAPNAGTLDAPLVSGFYPAGASSQQYIGLYQSPVWNWVRLLRLSGHEPSAHWHTSVGPDDMNGQIDFDASESTAWLWSNPSRYKMTYATLFDAAIWSADSRESLSMEALPATFKQVRWGMIAFPAAKGLIVNLSRRDDASQWHVGFADGSARLMRSDQAIPGVPIPWASDRQGSPILATRDGYLGRDF